MKKLLSVTLLFTIMQLNCKSQDYDLGMGLISWSSGKVYVGEGKGDKESNIFAHLFFDYYVVEKFAVGFYLNRSLTPATEEWDDVMTEFGMALKPRLILSDQFFLKPGLNLGYRILKGSDFDEEEIIRGFGLNFTLEAQYALNENLKIFGEFGFLSQPAGGNDFVDVTFAPILMFGAGACYSF